MLPVGTKIRFFLTAFAQSFAQNLINTIHSTSSELFDEVEAISLEHPVFDLVPPTFEQYAQHLYASLGKPQVSSDSFWNVYQLLLVLFQAMEADNDLTILLSRGVVEPGDEDVPVLPSLRDLPGNAGLMRPAGYQYMGCMANPPTQALHGVHDWKVQEEDQDDEDQPVLKTFKFINYYRSSVLSVVAHARQMSKVRARILRSLNRRQ
ncbi:hypothetical protein AZE42_12477 [Rhizopogon vesiculosus]|uniref:Uncharacterized protein n=1 Tax=Rhizopogon vesiculosus TaxID=180088 RepID=A0A1J8QDK4_9AGAM|nr:hypothetical protein AZE42_12477 [Rhizopogon vesiculosus]